MNFQASLGADADIRYFSLGRHALAAALRLLDLTPGAPVLLPAFICRDLLAAVSSAGGVAVFYPVDRQLQPALPPDAWPTAAAVLAVNYFGFPQDLAPFRAYTERTGARIIEDNAHGFLSRDAQGEFLGARSSIGIFSLRKTLPIPDGAALLVRDVSLRKQLPEQLPWDTTRRYGGFHFKQMLSGLPLVGSIASRAATQAIRSLRRWRTGHAIPVPGDSAEYAIPTSPAPYAGLPAALLACDETRESARRRLLYAKVTKRLEGIVAPVFTTLDTSTVPYGYPFFGDDNDGIAVNCAVRALGLEAFRWPELPKVISPNAPEHYRQIWWVNFLATNK